VSLAVGSFPQVVGPAWGVEPNLCKGHDMKTAVELSVPGAGEPVADNVAGRYVNRGGTGVGGERGSWAESADGTHPAEDRARSQGADTGQFGEGGARRGDGGLDVGGGFGDAPVQVAYLGDQVRGQASQGLAGGIAWTGSTQKLGGLVGGELTLRPGRDEIGEHDMEAVDGLGTGFDQVVAVFDDRT